ncbi:MAG: SCO family protein [Parvularculaceae bacterium]|nr:SCO family protein [Parvularculaceae bacterium]
MRSVVCVAAFVFFASLMASCGGEPKSADPGPAADASVSGDVAAPRVEVPAEALIELSSQFSADFALIDQDGAPLSDEDLRGKVLLVYFGFASCPDVCPLALGRLSGALNELTDAERAEIAPLFITVDPDRDTPEAMKSFLSFDDRIIGLTGDRAAVEAAKASFKVYAQAQPLADSALGYTVQHTSLFYLVDRSGQPRFAIQDFLTPQELAEMLRRAIEW